MKTKEELNVIKEEIENLCKKLNELTEEELKKVAGGNVEFTIDGNGTQKEFRIYDNTVRDTF